MIQKRRQRFGAVFGMEILSASTIAHFEMIKPWGDPKPWRQCHFHCNRFDLVRGARNGTRECFRHGAKRADVIWDSAAFELQFGQGRRSECQA